MITRNLFQCLHAKQLSYCARKASRLPKVQVELEKQVKEDIENETYKPRRHPGKFKVDTTMPEFLTKSMAICLGDHPVKTVYEDSKKLNVFLYHRHAPLEEDTLMEKIKAVENKFLKMANISEDASVEEKQDVIQKNEHEMKKVLQRKIHRWYPVNYNTYASLLYLIGRSAQDYAVLVRLFAELQSRNPDFQPRSFFDFGSGVGVGTWVAKLFWEKSLFEVFNVDISPDMNNVAEEMLHRSYDNVKGVFRRQFFPLNNRQYEVVLSAYSLLELPSRKTRLETILNLWNKTERFLIVVEKGTNVGFQVINEVRDLVLSLNEDGLQGHVCMPCPHDMDCPRVLNNDGTPCNFIVNYLTLPFSEKQSFKKETFSYVILEKGNRKDSDPQWPRIVRPVLKRSKHSICRLCTNRGKLEEIIFTGSRHGKITYHCARSSKWGDTIPVKITD